MENNSQIPDTHIAKKHGYNIISDISCARLEKIKLEFPQFEFKVY